MFRVRTSLISLGRERQKTSWVGYVSSVATSLEEEFFEESLFPRFQRHSLTYEPVNPVEQARTYSSLQIFIYIIK